MHVIRRLRKPTTIIMEPAPPLLVTFDALGTLVQIKGGSGQQYLTALQQFIAKASPRHVSRASPQLTQDYHPPTLTTDVSLMEKVSCETMRAELRKDREAWAAAQKAGSANGADGAAAVNPKEMPIGGLTEDSMFDFWRRAVHRCFHDPRIWSFADGPLGGEDGQPQQQPEQLETADRLINAIAPSEDWEDLYRYIIKDLFGTGLAYEWLPEARRTISFLATLAEEQRTMASSEAAPSQPFRLIALPMVLSNSDRRIATVLSDLGAHIGPWPNGFPSTPVGTDGPYRLLLGGVVTAMDLGRGKPSPLGLTKCLELARRDNEGQVGPDERLTHIHVGDAEEDRQACEAAPHKCHYLSCDPTIGARLEDLLAMVEEVMRK